MSIPARGDRPPRLIARQLAFGFGTVSVVAVVMCAMLLWIIFDVSRLVAGMRHDEASIRRGFELAASVRELAIHIAHSVIEADDSHLEHYGQWRERVRNGADKLSGRIPEPERWRLDVLSDKTQAMHDHLMQRALPAARRGDADAARVAHREIDKLAQEVADHADALARAAESGMVHAHVLAIDATQLGLLGGGLCVVLVLTLSVGFTLRLRAAVLKPLVALTAAARRFGRGDFEQRVGPIGEGELADLGHAFDRMAEELAHREARLLQNERMAAIGQLASGVAHELNNPIGIIRGYLKTMRPDGDAETLREELAILDEEASHCERIAADLLSYARAAELSLETIDMQEFLQETARRFRGTAAASEHPLTLEVGAASLQGDSARLRQLVLNLLTNAAQASPADAPVLLKGAVDGSEYRIEVEDHGPGVAPQDRARVFEPFFTKRRGGSGLGLSVCLGIVRSHHGSIEVTDAPGGGAVFAVRLPLRQPNASTAAENA